MKKVLSATKMQTLSALKAEAKKYEIGILEKEKKNSKSASSTPTNTKNDEASIQKN